MSKYTKLFITDDKYLKLVCDGNLKVWHFSPVHNVSLVSSKEIVNIILLNDSLEQFSCRATGVLWRFSNINVVSSRKEVVMCLYLFFCQNSVFVNVKDSLVRIAASDSESLPLHGLPIWGLGPLTITTFLCFAALVLVYQRAPSNYIHLSYSPASDRKTLATERIWMSENDGDIYFLFWL